MNKLTNIFKLFTFVLTLCIVETVNANVTMMMQV